MMKALQHHCQLIDQRAQKCPNVPSQDWYECTNQSVDGIADRIVDYLTYSGYFAVRLASAGIRFHYLQKFAPHLQQADLPNVFAIVDRQAVFVEIKTEQSGLSDARKETISALIGAGAGIYIAHDFQGFCEWFTTSLMDFDEADLLPFGPVSSY